MSRAEAPRQPRRRRVVLAVVAALILGGAGATVAVDVVAVQLAGHSLVWPYEQIATNLRSATWTQSSVLAVAIAAVVVGVLLILAALLPGKRKLLTVTTVRPDEWVGVGRRSVRRALGSSAADVDGVGSADVRLRRRKARIDVVTPLRDPLDLRARVTTAAEHRIEQIRLVRPPALTVRVRHRKDAADESPLHSESAPERPNATSTQVTAPGEEKQRPDTAVREHAAATDLAETGGQGGAPAAGSEVR